MEVVAKRVSNPANQAWDAALPNASEMLFATKLRSLRSFAALPSNVHAVESALLFANGLQPFVSIVGPSGWGKTHLLDAAAEQCAAGIRAARTPIHCATSWSAEPHHASCVEPLILDNVQDALSKPRRRIQLRIALERRMRAGWPTLLAVTADACDRRLRATLPSVREWILAEISPPTTSERILVVGQIAESERLVLGDSLRRILATRLQGNGRTIVGALKRLKLHGADWTSPQAVLRACGVLNPFFAANANWDLREHLYEVANGLSSEELAGFRASDLAVYGMLRVALLSEADVARFFKSEPAQVYLLASKVEQSLVESESKGEHGRRFVERAVETLLAS